MTDIYSARHADQREIDNADQAEFEALRAGFSVLNAGVRDEKIAGALDDLDVGDGPMERWHRDDVALDDEIGGARDEIQRRKEVLGDYYPFELNGNSLSYTSKNIGFYEYCLAISLSPSLIKKPFTVLPRSFERIVSALIRSHLGQHWAVYHTGAPRDPVAGKSFYACMTKLSEVTSGGREWRWDPAHTHPEQPSIGGDGGVDFVVWRPSPDNRLGQPYVVGQCACGNDWPKKFGDISEKALEKWFRPLSDVPIMKAFTTPFWLSEGNLTAATIDGGWTLDRPRLTIIANQSVDDPLYQLWISKLPKMVGLVKNRAA